MEDFLIDKFGRNGLQELLREAAEICADSKDRGERALSCIGHLLYAARMIEQVLKT